MRNMLSGESGKFLSGAAEIVVHPAIVSIIKVH